MDDLRTLVEANDPDPLLRRVDGLCASRDWDELLRLQALCREAVSRGKQLWSVDHHIDYRLALEAPGALAGTVVTERASRFLLGPLPEIAASTHTWNDLAPAVPAGPARAVTAHERVIRAEDLRADASIDPTVLEIPLVIEDWEPEYAVSTYASDKADFPMPPLPALDIAELPEPGTRIEDGPATDALAAIVATWTETSNGRVDIAAVTGTAGQAISVLGLREVALTELTLAEAMAYMGWAGASGGAHGRRRGAAAGRFAAWWAVAALTDLADDWPVEGSELAAAGAELRWYAFSDLFPTTGWAFHLAAEDPEHGLGWAIAAGDAA